MAGQAFPVVLDLAGRTCLLVGGGAEAERKAAALERAGAVLRRSLDFGPEMLAGVVLVIVADTAPGVAAAAARAAHEHRILVNVVDQPALCSFTMPAIVDRGPVVVAISTSGTAPALAKLLRTVLDRLLPRRLGDLAQLAGRLRPVVARRLADPSARRAFWARVFRSNVALRALTGRPAAGALLAALDLAAPAPPPRKP